MRTSRTLLLLSLLLAFGQAPEAVAAPKDKGAASEEPKLPEIVATGIPEFDPVFMQAKDIHTKIDTQNAALKDARKGVNKAAGVADDATLDDAMAAVKAASNGKLKLDNSGPTPRVKATEGAPQTTQDAATAVNKLLDAGEQTLGVAKDLEPQAKQLAETCAAFPGKLTSMNLDPIALAQASKKVTQDVKATGATPDRVKRLATSADDVIKAVTKAFAE